MGEAGGVLQVIEAQRAQQRAVLSILPPVEPSPMSRLVSSAGSLTRGSQVCVVVDVVVDVWVEGKVILMGLYVTCVFVFCMCCPPALLIKPSREQCWQPHA